MLQIQAESLEEADELLAARLKTYLDDVQKHAILEWKTKVRAWGIHPKELFQFPRNMPPAKTSMLLMPDRVPTHPAALAKAFHTYWSQIETWPPGTSKEHALAILDDHYSLFLPRMEVSVATLMDVAKTSRKSAPGLAGWSASELRALPRAAWEDALDMWRRNMHAA